MNNLSLHPFQHPAEVGEPYHDVFSFLLTRNQPHLVKSFPEDIALDWMNPGGVPGGKVSPHPGSYLPVPSAGSPLHGFRRGKGIVKR